MRLSGVAAVRAGASCCRDFSFPKLHGLVSVASLPCGRAPRVVVVAVSARVLAEKNRSPRGAHGPEWWRGCASPRKKSCVDNDGGRVAGCGRGRAGAGGAAWPGGRQQRLGAARAAAAAIGGIQARPLASQHHSQHAVNTQSTPQSTRTQHGRFNCFKRFLSVHTMEPSKIII